MKVRTGILIILGFMLMCSAASANAPVTSGLVAEYDFQTLAADGKLLDLSGNNFNGTITGANISTEGYVFNGSDYITLGTGLGSLDSGHTVIVALNESTINGSIGPVFCRYDYAAKVGFKIEKYKINGHNYPYYYRACYCDDTNISAPVRKENLFFTQRYANWSILTDRYDGSNVTLGFDGRPGKVYTGINYLDTQAYNAWIGRDYSSYYNGTIGYMMIYNRSLNDSELESNMQFIRTKMSERNVTLPAARQKFSPGYIVFTFDDSFRTDYTNAFGVLSGLGIPATSFINGDLVGTSYGGERMRWDDIKYLDNANWDMEDHHFTHVNITDLNNTELTNQLLSTNAAFEAVGLPHPEHIAYPYTNANYESLSVIKDYRTSGRGFEKRTNDHPALVEWDEPNYWNGSLDWYRLDQTGYGGETMSATIKELIDTASVNGNAIILFTHRVDNPAPQSGCTPECLEEIGEYALAKGLDPITMDGLYRAFQGIRTYPTDGSTLIGQTTGATYNKTVSQVGFVLGNNRFNNPGNVPPANAGYDTYWVSVEGSYVEQNFSHTVTLSSATPTYFRAAAKINDTWVYGEELCYDAKLNQPYAGSGLVCTISANTSVYDYSRGLTVSDYRVPMQITPTSGTVNVSVVSWTDNEKVWKMNSTTAPAVACVIGGFPAGTDIDIYRDGIDYATVRSNSTGYITWVYSGGFSEHTFEAIPHAVAGTRDSFASSWGNTVSMVGAIIVIALAGSMIAVFRGKRNITDVVNDLPGVILVVVLLIVGAIIFGQF